MSTGRTSASDGSHDPTRRASMSDGSHDPTRRTSTSDGSLDPARRTSTSDGSLDPTRRASTSDGSHDPKRRASTWIDPTRRMGRTSGLAIVRVVRIALVALVGVVALIALIGLIARADSRPTTAPVVPIDALRLSSDHWHARGFVEMEPPIRLPQGRARRDRTRIFVTIEGAGRIDVREGELVFPPGTIADRVEYRRDANGWSVADVRGTRFTSAGERFHAYRPERADGQRLFGAAWDREDLDGRHDAIALFTDAMTHGAGFRREEPGHASEGRERSVRRFARLLDCASCHGHERAEAAPNAEAELPRRGTDASGMHAFRYVLSDRAPMETYRAIDPNAADPFVHYECGGVSVDRAMLVGAAGTTSVRCASGDVPTLRYAVAEAIAAGDPRAGRVCASRLALAAWMTERARLAYADVLAPCAAR